MGAQTHAVARLGLVWLGTDRCVGHFVAEGENARRSAAREGGLLMMAPLSSLPYHPSSSSLYQDASSSSPSFPFLKLSHFSFFSVPFPPAFLHFPRLFSPLHHLSKDVSHHGLLSPPFPPLHFPSFFFHKHFVILSFPMFLFIFLLLSFFPALIPLPPFLSFSSPFILPSLFSLFSSCSSSFLHLPRHFSHIFHSQNVLSLECFQRDSPSSSHICPLLLLFHPPFPPSPTRDTSFLLFSPSLFPETFILSHHFSVIPLTFVFSIFLNFLISLCQKTCCPLCGTFLKMFPSFSPFSSSLILLYLFFLPDAVLSALLHVFK